MSEAITYTYVKQLLDKPNLSFVDFQLILSYLYKKLQILLNCKLKKEIVALDISLIYDVIAMTEIKIHNNQVEDLGLKDVMLGLLREYEKELERGECHSK